MQFKIIKPRSELLRSSIDYFLFIKSYEENTYTTFQNNNLCLALYKNNKVDWNKYTNVCTISESTSFGTSKLFGWHQKKFSVEISGSLDQICILFKFATLPHYTNIPLNNIDVMDDPFEEIFEKNKKAFFRRFSS